MVFLLNMKCTEQYVLYVFHKMFYEYLEPDTEFSSE